MNKNNITQFDRRLIEADTYSQIFKVLLEKLGKETALELVKKSLENNAFAAGKKFAQATEFPSIKHFSTVVERWQAGNAIEIEDMHVDGNTFKVKVTRCRYQEEYRRLGIPTELVPVLSCCRDEPFARGYDSRIKMERKTTLAEGGHCCPFVFRLMSK